MDHFFCGNSNNFAGAFSIAPIAASLNMPILLTKKEGTTVFLTHATQAQATKKKTISKYGVFADKYYIVGGKSALSDELVQSLVE